MTINPGDTIYNYVLRNGKLHIHEVKVIETGYKRKAGYFKDTNTTRSCPKVDDIGVILSSGASLWLLDRDDELAKRLFIEFEENGIARLQEQIDKKSKLVEMLKEL